MMPNLLAIAHLSCGQTFHPPFISSALEFKLLIWPRGGGGNYCTHWSGWKNLSFTGLEHLGVESMLCCLTKTFSGKKGISRAYSISLNAQMVSFLDNRKELLLWKWPAPRNCSNGFIGPHVVKISPMNLPQWRPGPMHRTSAEVQWPWLGSSCKRCAGEWIHSVEKNNGVLIIKTAGKSSKNICVVFVMQYNQRTVGPAKCQQHINRTNIY